MLILMLQEPGFQLKLSTSACDGVIAATEPGSAAAFSSLETCTDSEENAFFSSMETEEGGLQFGPISLQIPDLQARLPMFRVREMQRQCDELKLPFIETVGLRRQPTPFHTPPSKTLYLT